MTIEKIIKRSGQEEVYSPDKIMQAMEKSFLSCEDPAAPGELEELLGLVERKMEQDILKKPELISFTVRNGQSLEK